VTLALDTTVVDIADGTIDVQPSDGVRATIDARTVVWAAGVTASPLAGLLAAASGGDVDRAGRILVEPDLTLTGHPEVFAIGDMVAVRSAGGEVQRLPGVAPVAMQEGRHVAESIRTGKSEVFRYRDKGNLATIGRSHAVADVKGVHLWGFAAWITWLAVHLAYLIGFENRLLVLTRWTFSYLTRGRTARVIHRRN